MSDLFRFREVPDPDGLLEDLLGELIDNGALVEVTLDYGAAENLALSYLAVTPDEVRAVVDAAFVPAESPGAT